MTLRVADVNQVANVLASQAFVAGHPAQYLRELVLNADLPESWRREMVGQDFCRVSGRSRQVAARVAPRSGPAARRARPAEARPAG